MRAKSGLQLYHEEKINERKAKMFAKPKTFEQMFPKFTEELRKSEPPTYVPYHRHEKQKTKTKRKIKC